VLVAVNVIANLLADDFEWLVLVRATALVVFLMLAIVAVSLALISKRAVRGDQRDRTLRRIGHRLIRAWGTQFVDADLTGADFTGTDPIRCDARGATFDDVTWDPDYPIPVDAEVADAAS